ncbi:MAG: amidohydrolase family protein [Cellvibrionales bacterium]|jgi:N-acyl-D-aspartate/D-glutamate deacylase
MKLDLLIKGALVYDGNGGCPEQADVGIAGTKIVELGRITREARRTIDASGALLTPGFVDIHTHYDAQATWCRRLIPSSDHGVTTAIMGNCGVGFAPVRPADRDMLIELMEGVEDIPEVVMREGIPWAWESFEQYMDFLDQRQFDMDLGAQLPHAALRVYVMGDRGANREPATPADIEKMRKIAAAAMQAGAIGFSTSRWLHHKSASGEHTPSLDAGLDELMGIAMGMRDAGRGVFQCISEFGDLGDEFGLLEQIARATGCPISMSVGDGLGASDWRSVLKKVAQANSEGLEFRGQIAPRAVGVVLGLTASITPFTAKPSFRELAHLPLEQRRKILSDPQVKKRILDEPATEEFDLMRLEALLDGGRWLWEMDEVPNYEPDTDDSLAARADRLGIPPMDYVYDRMLANGGKTLFYSARANFEDGTLDVCREQLLDDNTVVGLGDGGAHVGIICDASFPTTLLSHWGRNAPAPLDLAYLIKKQTRDTARAVGLTDRGTIAVGKKADVNVIDFEKLNALRPEIVHDLPAGGSRFRQRATGYLATVVSGEVTYREGEHTGELPGRLVRATQA